MTVDHTMPVQWWREPFGMFQTNLREIDADMDVDQVADFILQHGATAWLTSVGGILANYPTDLDFQIINPLLHDRPGRDLIQDTLDAARARGIRLLGRMDFSKVQRPVAEAHPEWLYLSPNNTWQTHTNDLVSVCPSGAWYQERVFDIMDEVMSRYPLDGFFINWAGYNENDYYRIYHGVCHCDSCRRRWADYTGTGDDAKDLPDGPWNGTLYDEWKVFSNGVIDEWTARVRDFIADRLPHAALMLGESADIMFYEANNAVDREVWHHATSETASRFVSFRPDVPVLVNSASFLDHAYRLTSEEPEHYAQFHLQAISRGANPSTYILGVPGRVPWDGMEMAGDMMRFHRRHRDVYAGLRPVATTALVLPEGRQMEDAQYDGSLSEFKGLYKALQELHVPFDVLSQRYIPGTAENGGLQRYETIVVPNMGRIADRDARILDEWVAGGGTLVVTGAIGVEAEAEAEAEAGAEAENDSDSDNDNGRERNPRQNTGAKPQLDSLPVAHQTNFTTEFRDLWSLYMAPEQDETGHHRYQGPIVPLLHTYGQYAWKDGAQGRWKKLDFAPFAPPEYIYGNVQVDERGAGFASFGDGNAVLFTFPVGRGYRETGLSCFRTYFRVVLDEVAGGERRGPFTFDLSSQVEVTVNRNREGQTVVHLINLSGIRHQNFGERLPIPGSSIRLSETAREGARARTLVTGLELEMEEDGTVRVPGFELFEVVVFEGI
ncbi:hypothetical protein SODALDRAFT_340542 [Sodiomyces alkalinus F11]|uniref:Beta-galactosidase trimerisation domain-containing protein n=1 Tax=Sodiomyces alkalinus (strain CBS 110278 / VKM F-3762 / F11) TaxID=1314773 RepID=A0A3N2PRJ6_SODAK|nr:hypothetical protein SODALDRAFT_340542 [Sodiomyces alkalinus F11]ROT37141.1 hypothetical protein SODALDRAFT_340542 [Sodiomyces alkalinus F11]